MSSKRNLKSQQAISWIGIATLTTNKGQRKILRQYFYSLKQKLVSQKPLDKANKQRQLNHQQREGVRRLMANDKHFCIESYEHTAIQSYTEKRK